MSAEPENVPLEGRPYGGRALRWAGIACLSSAVIPWLALWLWGGGPYRPAFHTIAAVQAGLGCLGLVALWSRYPDHPWAGRLGNCIAAGAALLTVVAAWFRYALPREAPLAISQSLFAILATAVLLQAHRLRALSLPQLLPPVAALWIGSISIAAHTGFQLKSMWMPWTYYVGRSALLQLAPMFLLAAVAIGRHRSSSRALALVALAGFLSLPLEALAASKSPAFALRSCTAITLWLYLRAHPRSAKAGSQILVPAFLWMGLGWGWAAVDPLHPRVGLHVTFLLGFLQPALIASAPTAPIARASKYLSLALLCAVLLRGLPDYFPEYYFVGVGVPSLVLIVTLCTWVAAAHRRVPA